MRAIILAGGKGTRLLPYTTLIPKPLVPLGGKYSILEIIISQLARSGFSHITLAVNHLSHLIMAYFGDGSRWNVKIDYSIEDFPLSTIGPLTLIEDLPEHFLVMNGDILCDLNFQAFYSQHVASHSDVSVSTFSREVKVDFGVLDYDDNLKLTNFREKPSYSFDVSMGIYCLSRSVIEQIAKGTYYGFDHLMLDGIAGKYTVNILPFKGYWLDIGRPEDYQNADENFDVLINKLGVSAL